MMPPHIESLIAEHEIRFVLAQFVDIHGVAKTKSVPAHCLMDVVEEGAGFAGFAVWGWAWARTAPTSWRAAISTR